jgi:quercetin dioxygenase-like cupin family protein
MKISPYEKIESKPVEDPAASGVTMRIAVGPEDGAPNFVMRVFTVEPGGHTPRHEHPWEHEVFFHAGSGEVFLGGKTTAVETGGIVYVPAGALHQFVNTGPRPLVFVCVIPRPDK